MPQFPMPPAIARLTAFSPEALWQRYGDWLSDRLIQTLLALCVLLLGFWLARRIDRIITRTAEKAPRVDATVISVLASTARYIVLFFAMMLALQQLGVQTTSIVAVLGAATLAIGLALQGTLSNVAAGVVILLLRPYRLGDTVEIGDKQGVVRALSLFTTELSSFDNVKIVLPNSLVLTGRVSNFSHYPQRRIDLEFRIAHEDDFDKAIAILHAAAEGDPRVLASPALSVEVNGHSDFAVHIAVLAWCSSADWAQLKADLTKACLKRLRDEGLRQPYPVQRVQAD